MPGPCSQLETNHHYFTKGPYNLRQEFHCYSVLAGPNMCIYFTLSIQVCPKKGIKPTILLWGWDWDHQTYSREGYGCLGYYSFQTFNLWFVHLHLGSAGDRAGKWILHWLLGM